MNLPITTNKLGCLRAILQGVRTSRNKYDFLESQIRPYLYLVWEILDYKSKHATDEMEREVYLKWLLENEDDFDKALIFLSNNRHSMSIDSLIGEFADHKNIERPK